MKNRKLIIIGAIILVLVIISIIALVIMNSNKVNPEDIFNQYVSCINEKRYDDMYELISNDSKSKISKEDFVSKNKNIYEGIDSLDIKVDITENEKNGNNSKLLYNQEMFTSVGKVEFSNSVNLVKEEKTYKINWSTTLIHPELKDGYKIRVKTLKAERGSIVDRNGYKLAFDGKISSIGIVPRKIRRKQG